MGTGYFTMLNRCCFLLSFFICKGVWSLGAGPCQSHSGGVALIAKADPLQCVYGACGLRKVDGLAERCDRGHVSSVSDSLIDIGVRMDGKVGQ
jgi:hypothetical protein